MADIQEIVAHIERVELENEDLKESINDMARRVGDAGLEFLKIYDDTSGITLPNLKIVSAQLKDMVASNSLIKRGDQLRTSYVFGRGITFPADIPPRVQAKMDLAYNKAAMFSPRAWEEMNRELFISGNLFILRDTKNSVITRVPLQQITDFEYDPNSAERIWFIKREWSIKGKNYAAWYPLNTYTGPKRATIDRVTVDNTQIMYHESVNKQVGWALGIPDAFAAMAWALAYSEYIKNNSTLVRAYSQLAFKIQQKTAKGVNQAAAQVVGASGTGGTAVMGLGSELASLPANGSQVDFGNGRPIASLVASALGVSVVALLADPGAAGSSYGAAQTLDFPTIRVMSMSQASWVLFFEQVLQDFGMKKDFEVTFPAIETDAVYRQLTSLTMSFTTGAINQREYRAAVLSLLDIPEPDAADDLPQVSEFTTPSNYQSAADIQANGGDPVPSQGNSGAVPGGMNFDKNANRDDDAAAPTG